MIRCDERPDGLWTLTLDRADKANALTADMLEAVAEHATRAAGQARAVILTGAGRVFSAGADLEAVRAGLATDGAWERASGAIAALPCPTIAALNGTCAGGAFGIALACDIRLAVPGAAFFYPVMTMGYLPQPSDPARLAALVGPARAKLILLTGARLGAEEALTMGLVDRITPPEALHENAITLAEPALKADPAHAMAIKALCSASISMG